MKKILFLGYLSIYFILFLTQIVYPQSNEKIKFNYVFIVDISGSMEGKPSGSGNEVIFPKLKSVLNNFIDEIDNANILIYPFSGSLEKNLISKTEIKTNDDKNKLKAYINSLAATGVTTHIYDSFIEVINDANDFISKNKKQNEEQITLFYLYTDGRNEGGTGSMEELLELYKLKRGKNDWVFYTTLGIDANAKDIELMKENRLYNVRYEKEPKGNVSSIRLVHPVIPILNFGNIKKTNKNTQTQLFKILGKSGISQDIKIKAELEYKALHQFGVGLKFTPEEFSIAKEEKFSIELVNPENMQDGVYEDTIVFTSSDEYVYVIPDKITAKFFYTPDNIVTFKPVFGEEFPFNFDEITPDNEFGRKTIQLEFNEQAKKTNSGFTVKFEPDADNPSEVISGRDIIINDIDSNTVYLNTSVKEIIIKVMYSENLKEGSYEGKLIFEGSGITFADTEGLLGSEENPNVKTLNIEFTINDPWPLWIKILLFLIFILIVFLALWFGFLKNKKYLKFDSGELQITEPKNPTVYLKNNTLCYIGYPRKKQSSFSKIFKGSELNILSNYDVKITLKPVKKSNVIWVNMIYERSVADIERPNTGYLRHNEKVVIKNKIDPSKVIQLIFINIKNR